MTHGTVIPPALKLSDAELARIVKFVYERSGITLHSGKRPLIVARLQQRVHAGGFSSFEAYLRHVEADRSGSEISAFLDAIATNHTSFFREAEHFEFLAERIAHRVLAERSTLRIWCAACSSGEEPASIAMTLFETLPPSDHGRVRILASDLSTKALATAGAGVYKLDRVSGVPRHILQKYFERGLGAQTGLARLAPAVRRAIEFRRVNLVSVQALNETFDAVFCRNVMIYFDKPVQQRVVAMLERHVDPGGHLFIAHSESLNGVSHEMRWVAPAVYQRGAA